MPTPPSTSDIAPVIPPVGRRRTGGAATMAVVCVGGLLGVGTTGCAPSRDAAYEQILRGEIESAAAEPALFTAAFPENRPRDLATADAGD